MSKKAAVFGAGIIGLILATIPLLGSDNVPFLKWWLMVLVLGIGFYPLTSVLFSSLEDQGLDFFEGYRNRSRRISHMGSGLLWGNEVQLRSGSGCDGCCHSPVLDFLCLCTKTREKSAGKRS